MAESHVINHKSPPALPLPMTLDAIQTWFGSVDPISLELNPAGSVEEMAEALLVPAEVAPPSQPDLLALAINSGFCEGEAEYRERLREVALALVHRKLDLLANREAEMLQMIEALDDINVAANLLDERLYEWSRLHSDVPRGADLASRLQSEEGIGGLARSILALREGRLSLEDDVGRHAMALAPNLSSLAGPLLAARLISRAGGLKRLSQMPSSAIQVMGAEKSLFKHLKGKAPSPKHGLIFRHPAILSAPKWLRGRLSRALAGKLAIAARVDQYSGVPLPGLKESLDERLSQIRSRGRKRRG